MATGYTLEELQKMGAKPVRTGGLTFEQLQEMKGPAEQPKLPYAQRLEKSYVDIGQEIVSGIKKGGQQAFEGAQNKDPLQYAAGLTRSGLRTVGGVAKAAFVPILEAPVIKQASEFVAGRIMANPEVESIVQQATTLAKKYPEQAKDIQNIIDITTLGYAPKASSVLSQEGKAIGSDIAQGVKVALTPSEEAVQKKVISLFNKSIKPTTKKTLAQGQRYENDTLSALKTIKSNADQLNIEDATGELVAGRTPQTISELAQGVDQTKKIVFKQYDDLAKRAGTGGAVVDAKPIADEVAKVASNKALQLTNPELIKYAEGWSQRLTGYGVIDTETAQEVVKLMNNNLQAFYRNPTYESASKVAIDAGIANNFRKSLDDAIEGATGEQYQLLKNQYGALKAIENDVVRAAMREAKKNSKGLLDYTDMFTSGQMVGGILSLNPAMFTKGAVERGFKEYIKFLNDPNRAISNIFNKLDTSTVKPFTPESATFNYLQNPKLGASIEDVTKGASKVDPLLQEARKYKSAEEFVNKQSKVYHGTNVKNADMIEKDFRILSPEEHNKFPTTVVGDTQIGLSTSRDKGIADYFNSLQPTGKGKTVELYLSPKTKIYKLPDGINAIDELGTKKLQELKKQGYDAIEDVSNIGGESEIRILNSNVALTKSQLTDIFNKAHGKIKK